MARFARSGSLVLLMFGALLLPLRAAAEPILSVSPTSLSAQANAGTNAASKAVQVTNTGNGALKWKIVPPTATWLTVSPTTGVNKGTITLSFKTSGLAAGLYQASFRVESSTGSSTPVSIQLTVSAVSTPPPPPTLVLSCPGNMSRASSSGSPVVVTYSATTSGGVAPVTVSGVPASGSQFPVGTTSVLVTARSSDGQTATCGFTVTVTYTATAPPLIVYCPDPISRASSDGSPVAVTYTPTTAGGVAPVTVTGNPASGSQFPVGATSVQVTARSSDGQTMSCNFSVTVTYTPATVVTSYGPRSTITCPVGAVDIWPGSSIQQVVNLRGAGTTYCLRAGVHALTSAITPKTGDTFVGEYGAILDGTGWATSDSTQAAFRAHNQDIDNVTIRNLVIRKMPQKGIQAYKDFSDRWTIEYNEIASNKNGIVFPNSSIIRNNYIHHNVGNSSSSLAGERGGGYVGYYANDTTLDTNEIAYNGWEQKVMDSVNVTFRNNFVHHNVGDGIWYDGSNPGALIESNRVEDNGRNGIFNEAGNGAIVRNNTVRRSGDTAVFISTTQNAQIYNNTLEHNFRAITYFVNCGAVNDVSRNLDLKNNAAHDNTIRVGTQSGALATGFSYTADCTSTQMALYRDGSKNLTFSHNTYYVPSVTGWYWLWDGLKHWSPWQSFGHDLDGVLSQ